MDAHLKARVKALTSADPSARLSAVQDLAGDPQPAAATALVRALADSDDDVRQWVGEALENLGPPPADQLADLTSLARGNNDDITYWAVTLIGRLGHAATTARPLLEELAGADRPPAIRQRARKVLNSLQS
jgi:HEAT repeat protein